MGIVPTSAAVGSRDGNCPYLGCCWIEGWELSLPRLLLDRGMGISPTSAVVGSRDGFVVLL